MALINRLSRLFVADVHDILDQMEEPAALLRQAVREMESAVLAAETDLSSIRDRSERCTRRLQQLGEQRDAIGEKVELAMDAEDADLARAMLRRKLQIQQAIDEIRRQIAQFESARTQRSERLADWRVRLDNARQKLALVAVETRTESPAAQGISQHDVEAAYLAELKKRGAS